MCNGLEGEWDLLWVTSLVTASIQKFLVILRIMRVRMRMGTQSATCIVATRRGNIATRTQQLIDFGSPRSRVTSAMSLQENYQSGSQNIVVQGGRRVVVTPLGATTSTVTPRPQVRT